MVRPESREGIWIVSSWQARRLGKTNSWMTLETDLAKIAPRDSIVDAGRDDNNTADKKRKTFTMKRGRLYVCSVPTIPSVYAQVLYLSHWPLQIASWVEVWRVYVKPPVYHKE